MIHHHIHCSNKIKIICLLLWFEKMGLFYLKSPLMEKGMSEIFVDIKIVFVLYLQNQLIFSSFESLFLK